MMELRGIQYDLALFGYIDRMEDQLVSPPEALSDRL